jgi:hypothetical protein
MSGQDPPILVIDGEVQFELPEDKTTYSTLIMLTMMNEAERDLIHTFVAAIYNLRQASSERLDNTETWFTDDKSCH